MCLSIIPRAESVQVFCSRGRASHYFIVVVRIAVQECDPLAEILRLDICELLGLAVVFAIQERDGDYLVLVGIEVETVGGELILGCIEQAEEAIGNRLGSLVGYFEQLLALCAELHNLRV